MKAKFELDITSRKVHWGKMGRNLTYLPDESKVMFLLYYLLTHFVTVGKSLNIPDLFIYKIGRERVQAIDMYIE